MCLVMPDIKNSTGRARPHVLLQSGFPPDCTIAQDDMGYTYSFVPTLYTHTSIESLAVVFSILSHPTMTLPLRRL